MESLPNAGVNHFREQPHSGSLSCVIILSEYYIFGSWCVVCPVIATLKIRVPLFFKYTGL